MKNIFDDVFTSVIAILIFLLILHIFKLGIYSKKDIEKLQIEFSILSAEAGYFSGQQDALNKDIRIKYNEHDSLWYWEKSPWNSKLTPTWKPTKKGRYTEQF